MDIFGQMLRGSFVRLFFGFCFFLRMTIPHVLFLALIFFAHHDSARARFVFDFFLPLASTRAIIKAKIKRKRGRFTMRVLLRYKEPVCLLLSFAAILLVVTVYGLTHGFDSSATVDHKSPQILQELLPVDD